MAEKAEFFRTTIAGAPTGPLALGRGLKRMLVNPDIGARNMDVHINELKFDSGPGEIHYHAKAENVYIVLEGTLEVVIEGERHLLGPNEVGFIPPGVVHTAGNAGDAGIGGVCRIVEIYAPAGKDFVEVADWPDKSAE